jgi:6-phosphogluconate dehydrogenase
MVHNGIEYGVMTAYAEGLNILHHADVGLEGREIDAETSPLREPELYQYNLDLPAVTELWRRGSVIASWLLDLTAQALLESPDLAHFSGRVSDSGEGRWTSIAAIDVGAPAPILTTALYDRFTSRGESDFADKVLSAMRWGFGGHLEKKEQRDMANELGLPDHGALDFLSLGGVVSTLPSIWPPNRTWAECGPTSPPTGWQSSSWRLCSDSQCRCLTLRPASTERSSPPQ